MVRQQMPLKEVGLKKEWLAHWQKVLWEMRGTLEMLRTIFKRNAQKEQYSACTLLKKHHNAVDSKAIKTCIFLSKT